MGGEPGKAWTESWRCKDAQHELKTRGLHTILFYSFSFLKRKNFLRDVQPPSRFRSHHLAALLRPHLHIYHLPGRGQVSVHPGQGARTAEACKSQQPAVQSELRPRPLPFRRPPAAPPRPGRASPAGADLTQAPAPHALRAQGPQCGASEQRLPSSTALAVVKATRAPGRRTRCQLPVASARAGQRSCVPSPARALLFCSSRGSAYL